MHLNGGRSEHWMDQYRDELIQQVQNSRRMCKALLVQDLISEGQYSSMVAAGSSQNRMKQILKLIDERGQRGKDVLYLLLQEHEPELTLHIEQAMLVHTLNQRLIQTVKRVEPVAHRMLEAGLLEDSEYFQVCGEEEAEDRMKVMYQVLERRQLKQSAGFYNALFYCEPLLHRQLEKERVLQMFREDEARQRSDGELEESLRELVEKEKAVEEERDRLDMIRSELDREKELVEQMKLEMERWWRTTAEKNKELKTGGGWEKINNNNHKINFH